MRKIPTLFVRDPADMRRVTRDVHPACQWVLDGEGVATRKYDGTCIRVENTGSVYALWARREVKPGNTAPDGFVPVETDKTTGKTVGWEPWSSSPFAKFIEEARVHWAEAHPLPDTWHGDLPHGTYELCGPKINGNPEGYDRHTLIMHALAQRLDDAPRDFDQLCGWLATHPYEGIVWHHPDGRMAKLKRRDFADGPSALQLAREGEATALSHAFVIPKELIEP